MLEERAHRPVSLAEFKTAGAAQNLGRADLTPPPEPQYILRMPIRVEGGMLHVPDELRWIMPMLEHAWDWQQWIGVDHPFCYVTVRHGPVISKTDDEWHVDGFSTKVEHLPEQNYIWTDTAPTEYVKLNVEFPEEFDPRQHNVNHFLQQFVDEEQVIQMKARSMYLMDPYILHRRPKAAAACESRTFVRISFVPIEINDVNNTQNPKLPREYTADGVAFRNQLKTF